MCQILSISVLSHDKACILMHDHTQLTHSFILYYVLYLEKKATSYNYTCTQQFTQNTINEQVNIEGTPQQVTLPIIAARPGLK